jgi:2-dehydropantoate 2-reductase
MRIAVVGAGAIGACFGAMLAEAGCEISLIARGAHLDAIRANGLTIRRGEETRTRRLAASDKAVEIGPVEVVLFCVKLWSVEEAGEASQPPRNDKRDFGSELTPSGCHLMSAKGGERTC